jgi:hypothetical protein
MSMGDVSPPPPENRRVSLLVLLLAVLVAVVSARDYTGAWNDCSRLATIEALVDYQTLAIDRSLFERQTGDKLWINGRFYSDKSPVPALILALLYWIWQSLTGLTAAQHPEIFCYGMTLASCGVAYVIAVWCVYRLGRPLGLPLSSRLALTVSFALATVALPYLRHVNNHLLLLGVTAALVLGIAGLAEETRTGRASGLRLLGLGSLGGLAYSIDLGAGPVLLVCVLVLVVYRVGSWRALVLFSVAALPWLVLHHALNYAVGGTFKPANAVAEYFVWPGCSFTPQNMTGGWNHSGLGHLLVYAAALLFGKHGFIGHNLPLYLALPAIVVLLRRRTSELAEVLFAGFVCGGVWLAYAVTSNNYSGQCHTIRWFLPLLAPAYYVLAVFLREYPAYQRDFLILSGWGVVLAARMWMDGPWRTHLVPFFWPLQGAALLTWLVDRRWRLKPQQRVLPTGAPDQHQRKAA